MDNTRPIPVTALTIPARYVRHESQWALQVCAKFQWECHATSGEVRDAAGNLIAKDIKELTRTMISLGWIIPKDRSDPRAGILWNSVPRDPTTATEQVRFPSLAPGSLASGHTAGSERIGTSQGKE